MSVPPATNSQVLEAWTALRDEVAPWIGERATTLFACATATAARHETTAGYFARELEQSGDNPDAPQVTAAEQLLIDWGRLIASGDDVPAAFSERLEKTFSPERRSALLAFAGQTLELDQ